MFAPSNNCNLHLKNVEVDLCQADENSYKDVNILENNLEVEDCDADRYFCVEEKPMFTCDTKGDKKQISTNEYVIYISDTDTKEEASCADEIEVKSHQIQVTPKQENDLLDTNKIKDSCYGNDTIMKIKSECILYANPIKEETDKDDFESISYEENKELRATYRIKLCNGSDQMLLEQDSANETTLDLFKDDSFVETEELKLENISDEQSVKIEVIFDGGFESTPPSHSTPLTHVKRKAHEQMMLKCSFCDFHAEIETELRRHLKTAHPKIIKPITIEAKIVHYKCNYCTYQTRNSRYFKDHKETHKGFFERQRYECAICGSSYTRKYTLLQHIMLHNGTRKTKAVRYTCNECCYQTDEVGSFKRHTETHKDRSERRLLKCEICGNTYTRKDSLERHLWGHVDGASHWNDTLPVEKC